MTQLDIVCDLNRRLRERCEEAEAKIAELESWADADCSKHLARELYWHCHAKKWKALAKRLRKRRASQWAAEAVAFLRGQEAMRRRAGLAVDDLDSRSAIWDLDSEVYE